VVKLEGTSADSRTRVAVSVGTNGARAESPPPEEDSPASEEEAEDSTPRPGWELLDIDGDGKAELVWWVTEAKAGSARLIVLRF
jgi:hypothetical protein